MEAWPQEEQVVWAAPVIDDVNDAFLSNRPLCSACIGQNIAMRRGTVALCAIRLCASRPGRLMMVCTMLPQPWPSASTMATDCTWGPLQLLCMAVGSSCLASGTATEGLSRHVCGLCYRCRT